jgi:HD-like signal output (HDOD) protein
MDQRPGRSALAALLSAPPPVTEAASRDELKLMRQIDHWLVAPDLPADVLRRVPSVVPRLLSLMRQPTTSADDLALCISRDPALTVEVFRLASSVVHGPAAREADTLRKAITLLGQDGLQRAVSRVVLMPLMAAGKQEGLFGRASDASWHLSLRQADYCANHALEHGLDRIEAYLAGLVQGGGRLSLLSLLDRSDVVLHLDPKQPWSIELDRHFLVAAERLLGHLLRVWSLSPRLDLLARLLRGEPPEQIDPVHRSSLVALHQLILESEQHCLRQAERASNMA